MDPYYCQHVGLATSNIDLCRDLTLFCCASYLAVMVTRTFSRPACFNFLAINPWDLYYRGY